MLNLNRDRITGPGLSAETEDARYDDAGNASALFTTFANDFHRTPRSILDSKHWVDFPSEA
ncbi:MAG: hypothetical protein WCK86_15955 [Planctomycetia bacterium]